ncbi:MAG: RluA family pseudouridine synthase [Clostridiales bacterium]|nr:RluA family pseudouridine synthase [Clostridiales bacterium]
MACYEWKVTQAAEGQRIDASIRRFLPEIPPHVLRASFQRRDVKLDGKRVKPDARVTEGQLVQVYCMEPAAAPVEVVYEDEDVLLINKRAGVSVEPDEKGGASLTELAHKYILARSPGAQQPRPCHRLDNQTCGLILFAKNDHAEEILLRAFRDRTMDKRYICLVRGMMKPPAATCKAFLLKDAEAARVTILDHPAPGARSIVTAYETLEAGPISRLRVHLLTGRTHQIRAHLAALGHPLLGDDVYGDRAFNRANHARRLMLCAASLTLDTGGELPRLDGKTFTIDCPF